ncbi:type II secretion system GspH family protein [Microgenomates group bacterium]|nr:type II secretion system GspH family protein [Microgenomates group bacterium]
MSRKKQDGFSLIELMVVVSIMAILAVIGLGGFANAQRKARDSRRKADVKTIQNAMISSSDMGGNLAACSARAEAGGTFPVDPRVTGSGAARNNDAYFLFAPAGDCPDGVGGVLEPGDFPEILYIINESSDNVGMVCSTLEAPNTGNTAYVAAAAEVEVAAGTMRSIIGASSLGDTDNISANYDTALREVFGVERAPNGSLVINNCQEGENCHLFCATF